jgi:RimJ/RimL family protein N-acetyltransferase
VVPWRLRLIGSERAGRARYGPRTSVDALRADGRRGRRGTGGAGGRRAELAQLTIRLEPLGERHLSAIEEMLGDSDLLRFTRIPEPVPPGFARAWIERYEEGRRDGSREAFAVVDGADELLGIVMAPQIDREAATAELGYVVAPAARGRGVATEALRRLTQWAFDELGMLRVELLISHANGASKKVAERCGYVFEGVLRSAHFKQGLREDTEIWSRLPTDP